MTPTLIGYFPKRKTIRSDWLKNTIVEEICTVSGCICEAPKGWIDLWQHNEMLAYDTTELAWNVVPQVARANFEIHAYRMFPVLIESGTETPWEFPSLNVQTMPDTFELLGYDVVVRDKDSYFACSPLSCNGMADEVEVNRHCLLTDEQTAFRMTRQFEESKCEPGPYCVVEVWRERRAG